MIGRKKGLVEWNLLDLVYDWLQPSLQIFVKIELKLVALESSLGSLVNIISVAAGGNKFNFASVRSSLHFFVETIHCTSTPAIPQSVKPRIHLDPSRHPLQSNLSHPFIHLGWVHDSFTTFPLVVGNIFTKSEKLFRILWIGSEITYNIKSISNIEKQHTRIHFVHF